MLSKFRLLFQVTREAGSAKTVKYLWRRFILRDKNQEAPNTVSMNRWVWTRIDWSKRGEEWTSSDAWKASLVKHVLEPNIPIGSRVLEIGPGGGRWTEVLVQRAAHVIAVDLTPKCIEICREKFQSVSNIEFHVNDGRDLSFIPPNSIDRIWSCDVFVHINSGDVENYVRQFAKILAPGGVGVIHHAKNGHFQSAWRSDMTAAKMREYCAKYGLKVVSQFDSWDNDRVAIFQGPAGERPDIISIFSKPQQ